MSKLSSRVASALSFAHLAGIGSARGKNARAEDEDDDRKNDDQDDDQGDDEDRDNGNGKRGRKAKGAKRAKAGDDANEDDDSDDEHAEDEDLEDEGDDGKKSRRAKGNAASDDDDDIDAEDDEDEMHGKSAAAQARRRERARCAAIFGSRYAAKNPTLAANLAFNTSMTRKQALAVLRDTPAGAPAGGGRADRNPNLGAGGDQSPSRHATIASRWDRAMSKVSGR